MSDPDFEIILRILAGDTRAYAELVDRHKDRAMTLAMRLLRNREDAEEALQDAFVRAFRALDRFEMKSTFSTWFYRIVYNVCSSALSRRGDQIHVSIDDGSVEANGEWSVDAQSPGVDLESREFQQLVHAAIGKLPPVYAAILTLFLVQDLGYDEIVQVTGLPLGTVKNRLFRARMMLRDLVLRKAKGAVGEVTGSDVKTERIE